MQFKHPSLSICKYSPTLRKAPKLTGKRHRKKRTEEGKRMKLFFLPKSFQNARTLFLCRWEKGKKSGQLLSIVRSESQENTYFQINSKAKHRASSKSDAIYAAREYRAGGQRKFESWYPTEITVFRYSFYVQVMNIRINSKMWLRA